MKTGLKELLKNVASESIKLAIDASKETYPKILKKKDQAQQKINYFANDVAPKVNNQINESSQNISKFVLDKYSEAMGMKKEAEKEKKKIMSKGIRRTLIGTGIGLAAGAVIGLAIYKKSQIKDSDYVFSDDDVFEEDDDYEYEYDYSEDEQDEIDDLKTNAQNNEATQDHSTYLNVDGYELNDNRKTYQQFDSDFEISNDGTTLIAR